MATALGWDDGWKSDTVALFILWCGAVLQLFSLKIHTDGGLIFSRFCSFAPFANDWGTYFQWESSLTFNSECDLHIRNVYCLTERSRKVRRRGANKKGNPVTSKIVETGIWRIFRMTLSTIEA